MLIGYPEIIWVVVLFFVIAMLYASVGFGGGSSYLAILALVLTSFLTIRSTALVCNLLVVTGSCYLYYRKGHLIFRKFLPFIVTSIPLAFVGASFRLEERIFFIILGFTLVISSLALAFQSFNRSGPDHSSRHYPPYLTYVLGAVIGLLSGLVGIGGGIFLAPLLNHMRWDTSIRIAALASFFILVNSVSGIAGMLTSGTFQVNWLEVVFLAAAVIMGGQLGIRYSLIKLSGRGIKIITSLLVFIVGVRVLLVNGWGLTIF